MIERSVERKILREGGRDPRVGEEGYAVDRGLTHVHGCGGGCGGGCGCGCGGGGGCGCGGGLGSGHGCGCGCRRGCGCGRERGSRGRRSVSHHPSPPAARGA